MQENQIIDTEVTEVKEEAPFFNPVEFLTNALRAADYVDPTGWRNNIDPRAEIAEDERERIFFANRALRLFLSEVEGRENISPRMLLADGIDSDKWIALMEQGVIPWLMNQFDNRGKRITQETEAEAEQPTMEDTDPEIASAVVNQE